MIRTLLRPFSTASLLCSAMSAQAGMFGPIPYETKAPENNPTTEAKVELGKQLFFDPRLSTTGTISCNSCHNLMAGGDDSLSLSVGVSGETSTRNAPTVWNAAFQSVQDWDGRAATLEEQVIAPLTSPNQMGKQSIEDVVARLGKIEGYRLAFNIAFESDDGLTGENLAKAIASFERTLTTPDSPFDQYLRGDEHALSEAQKRGLVLFDELGCDSCHNGINLSGPEQPPGTPFVSRFPVFPSAYDELYNLTSDPGRFLVTDHRHDKQQFRVPNLRNITLTAPYFHNGSVSDLRVAVQVMAKSQLKKKLSETEVSDIVAFLSSLTGRFPQLALPRLPITPGISHINNQTTVSLPDEQSNEIQAQEEMAE